jgi:Spy/CpxP family protein refolding chaperone
VETARAAGDVVTLRRERRDAVRQIVQVLTPEQREAAKTAIEEIPAKRQSRSQ